MHKRAPFTPALLMAGALFGAVLSAGCDNEPATVDVEPKAVLVISVDPNPTPFSRIGTWTYEITVSEVNGVGVHIYGWTRQGFSAAGEPYASDEKEQVDFEKEFLFCGGEGNYIEPGGERCSTRTLSEGRNAGYQVWTFFGVDDSGNEVEASVRQELI